MKFIHYIALIIVFNMGLSQDVVLSLEGGNLNYVSAEDIAGFQFSHDGCVNSFSGGLAEEYNFQTGSSDIALVSFSLDGAVIPSGIGNLIFLDGNVTSDCLFDFIFSDPFAQGIEIRYNHYGCSSP